MNQLLADLRIVEFSAFVAAPLGGMTMAQLGAEVDTSAVRAELEAEDSSAQAQGQDGEESATARYLRALLRAAGDQA